MSNAGTNTRATVAAALRVVSTDGSPIDGARVAWSSLSRAWLDRAIHWPDLDWQALDRNTRTFVADADGRVVIDGLPREANVEASVLWITHPAHRARSVVLAFPSSTLELPPEIVLEPCAPIVVRVVDPDGKPAQGATIVELVDFSRDDALVEGRERERAPYVLRSVTQSDASGSAQLAPFLDKHYVYAVLGELRSEPWLGNAPANVTLELRPTFRARGRVTLDDGGVRSSDLRVKCTVFRGYDTTTIERVAVRSDGTWGDITLPLVKCDEYVFSFRGGDFAEELHSFPPPEAGSLLTVDFHPTRGVSIPIRVVDTDGAPLKDATASAHWSVDGKWHGLSVKTDAGGNAVVHNCLAGQIWVRARADRYMQKTLPEMTVTAQPTEPFVVQLDRAGRIAGRCMRDGKPVSDYSVLYWPSSGGTRGKKTVTGSVDGSFTIDESPLGEVQLVVTSNDVSRGDGKRITVEAGVVSNVEFELASPISGKGRVIDGATGEPVQGARVQVYITDPMRRVIVEPWKSADSVRSDGSFDLAGLSPGENTLAVTAPGYGRRDVRVLGVAGQEIDFGSIGVHRQRSAQIQLVSNTPTDFTRYRASLEGAVFVPEHGVPADGRLRYENLDVDHYTLTIRSPDGLVRTDDVTVRPGQDTYLEIPVSTTPIAVEVDSSNGTSGPYRLRVGFLNTRWLSAEHTYSVPDTGRVQIDGMTGDWMVLRLFDGNDRCVGIDEVALKPTPPPLVRLRARSDGLKFRVTDSTKHPVPGVRVVVTTPNNDSGWSESLQTDERGECSMAAIALPRVFVLLHHPDRGTELSRSVDVPEGGKGTIDLTFAPQCALRVRLMEGNTAIPDVEVSIQDSQRLLWGLGAAFTDRAGTASWAPISAGDVDFFVMSPGYWWSTKRLRVSNATEPIPIQVRKTGNVDLIVKDDDGNPLGGVALDFHSKELNEWASTWIHAGLMPWPPNGLTSDAEGHIRASGFPSGEYQCRVLTGGSNQEQTIHVPVHDTVRFEVKMP